MAKHPHHQLRLDGAKAALLREPTDADAFQHPQALAAAIRALPITLLRPRPLDEAISSAGGVPFETLDHNLMLNQLPACSAPAKCWIAKRPRRVSAYRMAEGMLHWLDAR